MKIVLLTHSSSTSALDASRTQKLTLAVRDYLHARLGKGWTQKTIRELQHVRLGNQYGAFEAGERRAATALRHAFHKLSQELACGLEFNHNTPPRIPAGEYLESLMLHLGTPRAWPRDPSDDRELHNRATAALGRQLLVRGETPEARATLPRIEAVFGGVVVSQEPKAPDAYEPEPRVDPTPRRAPPPSQAPADYAERALAAAALVAE